jgi:hypothetical protein
MKKFMSLLLAMLLGSVLVFGQEGQDLSKKEMRKLRKEQKKEERVNNLAMYTQVAEDKEWVLEAHTVYNKYGNSFQMDPTINFVSISKNEAVIQLGVNGFIGYNGLGGITLEGNVTNYEVMKEDETVMIRFIAMGSAMGPVDVIARISPDGFGRLTVSGNWGRRLTFAGYFLPYENSRTYTGTPVY